MSEDREDASQRSAFMVLTLDGCAMPAGMGGSKISVRITEYDGSFRRRAANSWPMKPAAPVMRIFGIARKKQEMDMKE